MNDIREIQKKIGTTPDGAWGPKSQAACVAYLRSLMPKPNPWPSSADAAMIRFFGQPGDESNLVNLDVHGLEIFYEGNPVRTIRCHKKVADSLHRVLSAIAASPFDHVLRRYAGCFNHRPMRGGSRPSKHSWGAAIDLDPDTNMLKTPWPQRATMPFEVMEMFAREGWVGLGWRDNRDAMHFQTTCD